MVTSSGSPRREQGTPRSRRTVVAGAVIAALLVVAVVLTQVVTGHRSTGTGQADAAPTDAEVRAQTTDRLTDIAEEIADRYDVSVGVSMRAGEGVIHAGTLQDVRAWSTTKVPVAVAAVRAAEGDGKDGGAAGSRDDEDGGKAGDAGLADDITDALTMSDNDAAMRLWYRLGSWQQGSRALTRVLRETGDTTDAVAAESAADYTGFGDIHWTLDNQVTFADRLACLDGAEPVLDAMGQVVPVQRLGLGVLPGARFKGGWGPENDGTYVLREFGLVGEQGSQVPVAYAVVPDDGSDVTAREAAEALARKLGPLAVSVADQGGAAQCQVPDSVPAASTEAPLSDAEYAAQYGGGA